MFVDLRSDFLGNTNQPTSEQHQKQNPPQKEQQTEKILMQKDMFVCSIQTDQNFRKEKSTTVEKQPKNI